MQAPSFKPSIPPDLLLQAYRVGVFPMAPDANSTEVQWFEPHRRGIIPLEDFKVSKNVRRAMRNTDYEVRFNTQFEQVMRRCGERDQTWISDVLVTAYKRLHEVGHAHSVEIWQESELVGGLYGVSLGSSFFGESMFQQQPEMHKFALWHCHQRLIERGFMLWDTQFYTEHLGRFGAVEIPQEDYLLLLEDALVRRAYFDQQPD